MTVYARITLVEKIAGRPQRFILEVTRETDRLLCGIEVGTDGDEIVRPKADVTKHIIDKTLIKKREAMTMNKHYGLLEVTR